tara:strand:+ start:2511 stop:4862 length:2352 start_codon:yes stop_codon:yes gene_type:complete
MGCLVKSSLSALSSVEANVCPSDLTLDQYYQTFNGDFQINFISALSGIQDFKNLNYSNFYLSNNFLLDNVTSFNEIKVKPDSFFTTFNFSTSGNNYLIFKTPSLSSFKDTNNVINSKFYGATSVTNILSNASDFEITFVDDFTCSVATVVKGIKYFLVVSDNTENTLNQREVLFVAENKLSTTGGYLEYNLVKYGRESFINLYSYKNNEIFAILNNGKRLYAQLVDASSKPNQYFVANNSIKIDQEVNLNIPSPYNSSFITYDNSGDIDNKKSDFNLPSNYLFYSSSNDVDLNFNFFNLKNIVNTQEQFTSSNNLLSTSETTIFSQGLREYTSIFSDMDSENNEVLALNFVYNNFDINIKSGTTYFTTPSSMEPFTKLNINDTKFTKCGSFSFKRPDLSDRVYRLDDNSIKEENVTYLCTWLSGGIGKEGVWVDRYYYPDLVSKEAALAASPVYNVTYEQSVESLIMNNSSLKSSVEKKLYLDKKSDLTFEPNKRYKYVRVSKNDFLRESPTNFCKTARVNNRVNNYFKTINENGGFSLGFTLQNEAGDFSIISDSNDINGGISFTKTGNDITFEFKIFDNSTEGKTIEQRIDQNTFTHSFIVDKFEKNNIFLSFNAIEGICNLYLNSNVIFSFNVNAYQLFTKRILFGDIFVRWEQNNEMKKREILYNEATTKLYITNLYLTLEPLEKYQELGYVFGTNIDTIQDLTISLPCGMRNMTDTIRSVNSINTNLKSKSNAIDINIKNLNIKADVANEIKDIMLTNIVKSLPKTAVINDVKFIDYK